MSGESQSVDETERKEWLGRGWAFPVQIDPRTGGVKWSAHELDIRQSIQIILGTARGERVMRPDFGCGIHDLVFEVIDVATLTRVEAAVLDAMRRYEARIEVLGVRADPLRAAEGKLLIEMEYRVRRTNQIGNLVYPFYFREGAVGLIEESRR
ncbi:GPW/gp25 family protein [Dongia sp.]|uniref:GPW/gp25 family protein n=1 Tax=Dongia sp. TaxID=1977262 RepID=UPI0037510CD9